MEPEKLEPLNLPSAPENLPASEPELKIETGTGPLPNLPANLPSGPQPDFFSPETIVPSPIPEGVSEDRRGLRTVLLIVAAVVFIGALGSLSYFVIFPLLFPSQAPATIQQATPQVSTHKSFLIQAPAAEAEIRLPNNSYQAIASSLQNESFNQLADRQFKEVKISDLGGQVGFPDFLTAMAPAASALGGSDWFEKDFTAVLYYESGVWPVYVAKLKPGVDPATVQNGFRTLENILEFENFYLAPPGTFSAFKDGKAGNYGTRYAVGTQPGAAFNYGVLRNYLIMSTNYNALKSILPLLGL